MVEKLKSVFRINQLRLVLKTVIFAGLLFWARASGFAFLPVLIFLAYAFAVYFRGRESAGSESVYAYLVLLAASLSGVSLVGHLQFLVPAVIFFSFIFYAAMGVRSLVFVRRYEWSAAKNLLLLYAVFLIYFLSDKYDWFFVKYISVFFAVFFILNEWLSWLEHSFPKRYRLVALVLSFIILQLLWAVSLLPLGFINSATLMLVSSYLLADFCAHHFHGAVNKKLFVRYGIILAAVSLVIYFLTNWRI